MVVLTFEIIVDWSNLGEIVILPEEVCVVSCLVVCGEQPTDMHELPPKLKVTRVASVKIILINFYNDS